MNVALVMQNMAANALNARRFVGAVLDELSREENEVLVKAEHLVGMSKGGLSTDVKGRKKEVLEKLGWLFPEGFA